MELLMDVIKIGSEQKKRAAEVLTAAFYHYPQQKYYFPDLKKRTKYLEWYMANVLNCALRYGEVFAPVDLSGVIFILPPGRTKISTWEYARNGFLFALFILGLRQYSRMMECEDFAAKVHEEIMEGRPHYYLWGVAVDPGQQRKGVGKILLNKLLEKADSENKPIYLETHDEKNVFYYQQKGFELAKTDKISGHTLQIWCMVREPKPYCL
jgi:GNAT superfamily N-acetyltransferase